MIAALIKLVRKVRRKYITDDFFALPWLRRVYHFMFGQLRFFAHKGIPVDIGGYGYFRIHPKLVFGAYNYEEWGTAHNAGFQQWIEACRGKRVVVDVGAHIGLYALPASKVLAPEGQLFAFEPADTNQQYLLRHLGYNKIVNIEVVPDLLGDQDSKIDFFEDTEVNGTNTIAHESIAKKDFARRFRKMQKRQIRLDDFCTKRSIVPEVIKIDVEGAELGVLNGAREILASAHPLIFLSVHPVHLKHLGSSVEELYELICDLGYGVYTVDGKKVNALGKEEYILRP